MSFPHWQSNQTNVDRTNGIIEQIALQFGSVVPIIAPLNECVSSDVLSSILLITSRRSQAGWI